MRDPVYNSTTSINKYFELQLKPALEKVYGSSICIYFEDQQKQLFPNITILHPNTGDKDTKSFSYLNEIVFHLNVTKAQDNKARKMIDRFYSFTGLNLQNVSNFVVLPVYDYDVNPIQQVGCMRLYIDSGFFRMPESDPMIRHYKADLRIQYQSRF